MSDFQTNKKLNLLPLPYIGMYDLDLIYQTSDVELLYQVLSKVNEIAQSQNITIDNFEKILEWAQNQIESYTKEQLQEWLNDGTLENMIMALGQIIKYFDTTEEMLQSQNLQIGQVIKTLGYNTINDGGGALFIINDTNNGFSFECENSLYAQLIYDDYVNIKQCGGIENNDISSIINKLFSLKVRNIYIPKGSYNLNKTITLSKDINDIEFNITGDFRETMLYVKHTDHAIISNITLLMDGIRIECDGINKSGLYITGGSNCKIKNCSFNGNGYNGIDLSSNVNHVVDFDIDNCYCYGNKQNGIYIHNYNNAQKTDIRINKCYIVNNGNMADDNVADTNGSNGIYVVGCLSYTINQTVIEYNHGAGIRLDGSYILNSIWATNNYFEGNRYCMTYLSGSCIDSFIGLNYYSTYPKTNPPYWTNSLYDTTKKTYVRNYTDISNTIIDQLMVNMKQGFRSIDNNVYIDNHGALNNLFVGTDVINMGKITETNTEFTLPNITGLNVNRPLLVTMLSEIPNGLIFTYSYTSSGGVKIKIFKDSSISSLNLGYRSFSIKQL